MSRTSPNRRAALCEIILELNPCVHCPQRCSRPIDRVSCRSHKTTKIREDSMMRHRPYLVGAAMGLFACVAIASTPAMATPCTNLQSLQLQHTTTTSETDTPTGVFVVPGSSPPAAFTGLPPFCRVTAILTPSSDSTIKIE